MYVCIYTVIHKKMWQYICDHNSGETRLFFNNFCTPVCRKNIFTHTCSPHLNNVLMLPCDSETWYFKEYYPLHWSQIYCHIFYEPPCNTKNWTLCYFIISLLWQLRIACKF